MQRCSAEQQQRTTIVGTAVSSAAAVAGFLALALPMVVSRAGIAGMSIADAIMVGRHNPTDLALLGLAEGTLGRLLDVLAALLLAGLVLAARAAQGPTPDQAGAIWRRAVTLSLLAGVACTAIGLVSRWWLGWLFVAPTLAAGAAPVVAVLGAGVPMALVALVTAVFLEATGHATIVAGAVVAANIANLGLNWLLIDGAHGVPALGVLGSAISTSLVRWLLAAGLVCYSWWCIDHARLGLRQRATGFWHADAAEQRRLGGGAAATAAVLNLLGISLTLISGWLGAIPLAAMTALWSALSIGALLALGVADATAMRVAGARGAGHEPRSRAITRAITLGLTVVAVALALVAVAVIAAPGPVADLYDGRPGPQRDTLVALLPLGGLILLLDGAGFVVGAALRGLSDVVWPTAIQIGVAALLAPSAWWLAIGLGGGTTGLVQAILATSLLRTAALATRLYRICPPITPASAASINTASIKQARVAVGGAGVIEGQ